MLKKNNGYPTKNTTDRTTFLADDSYNSSKNQCYNCSQYQQDIHLLQQKLMETHNKLIEQIDICREQQIKIIKLSANQKDRDNQNYQHAGNRQQAGKLVKKSDQNYMHSIEPLIQAKTQLLRNDLQAMRAKVLSEILKSNKLKQQNNQLEMKHQIQVQQFRDKIKKLESARNKLVDQNQRLYEQIQEIKLQQGGKMPSKFACNCGYQNKFYQLDKAFMNQRLVTTQLLQQNSRLQNKVQDLYEEKAKGQFNENSYANNHRVQQIRTQPKKKAKTHNKQKHKQQFEATKNLIKQLQQAELELRKKHNKN